MVSFFHGNNDGQKGVGLIMLILIGIVPGYFALNEAFDIRGLDRPLSQIETIIGSADTTRLSAPDAKKITDSRGMIAELSTWSKKYAFVKDMPRTERFQIRKDLLTLNRNLKSLIGSEELNLSPSDKTTIEKDLKALEKTTDYAPLGVIALISVSLGLGTMIGWKRIVKTIGEKIGKQHLTYAQGASSELVAASTIGLSSYLGLPVSTTHVLSSGIAGSMVASKGIKNLQPETVRNILIAWLLTLPVVMVVSGSLFLLFRYLF
jgi:PiT family inorganic phosphate transporter